MTPSDFMDFADELGVHPSRIDVALVPHWRDAMLSLATRWMHPAPPLVNGTVIQMWTQGGPVEIAYDPSMKSGEFTFRY